MSNQVPTGTVTLMFTDIEGHTKMWEQIGDDFMPILEEHNTILRSAAEKHNGYEVKTEGDSFMLAFTKASDAVLCAVEAQIALADYPWPEDVGKIRVRIGMHTGEPQVSRNDYFGPPVIRANRISEAGYGGQTLISAATKELVIEELPKGIEFVDLGLHRLKDLGRPERIFQVNHPSLPQNFPLLKTLDNIPNNLPVQLTSFVGREAEIRRLAEFLGREQVRLVTLTGAGGIGKTRLSIEVAAEQLENFPDGVWFVPLASLNNPEYVITEIASALSIQLQPKVDPKKQVIDYLAQKHLLLVLDNFEHIPEAAYIVNDLLRSASSLRCIVTSRELLRVSGEQTFSVPPLKKPTEDADIEALSQYESVRLFLERAQTVKPDFALTPRNAAAIAAICHHLAGIPLAIELAAARVRGITAQQIFERLSRQFEFLTTRRRDVAERHRTLRAALDWSYELLDPDEQELFAQLSVFSGGFFLEAAEAICDVPDVFELLFSLQDKSLLTVEEVMEQTRYLMLEPLREYAKEKLGESLEFKKAHAEHYLSVAQELDQKLQGVDQGLALSLMALELDNFRVAMDFAQEQEQLGWKLLGELGAALSRFFYLRGLWSEGMQRLRQAEGALRNLKDNNELLAKALHGLGRFHQFQGDYEVAQNLYTEALQVRREIGDKPGIAALLTNLGIIAENQGAYHEARELHTKSLQIKQELRDKQGIAVSLDHLGVIAESQSLYDEAKQLFTESLQMSQELGDKECIAHSLNNLGVIARYQGAYEEARQLYTESLQIFRELGNKQGIAYALNNLGDIAVHQEIYDEAKQLYTESLQMSRELGDKRSIAASIHQIGKLVEAEGDSAQAALFILHANKLYEEMKAASSKDAMEVQEALAVIQKEIGTEQFEIIKQQAETMSVEKVIELVLA
ncbi:tetratricopeptide repeat protein [bacterium]|nr:tetratricopeptide repeat protein [bacterium]